MSTSCRVFNHWTFAERHELEALALEAHGCKECHWRNKECQTHHGGIDQQPDRSSSTGNAPGMETPRNLQINTTR